MRPHQERGYLTAGTVIYFHLLSLHEKLPLQKHYDLNLLSVHFFVLCVCGGCAATCCYVVPARFTFSAVMCPAAQQDLRKIYKIC